MQETEIWVGRPTRESVAFVEAALERFGEADSPDRSRLLAGLAIALNVLGDTDRAADLLADADDVARRCGDRQALYGALVRQNTAAIGRGCSASHFAERYRILDEIAALVGRAETAAARRPDAVRERIAEQVAALLDASDRLDRDRLHQEAVLIAAKADVREELDRLAAHVEQAQAMVRAGGPVGRRLDFLSQEFNRESNTLCAKANDLELTHIGLELKTVVEQFREQVQNLE